MKPQRGEFSDMPHLASMTGLPTSEKHKRGGFDDSKQLKPIRGPQHIMDKYRASLLSSGEGHA